MINFTYKEKDNERVKNIDIEKIISKRTNSNKKKLKSLKITSNINNFNNINMEDFRNSLNSNNNSNITKNISNINQNYLNTFSPEKILSNDLITSNNNNNVKSYKKSNKLPKININKKRSLPIKTESSLINSNFNYLKGFNNNNINIKKNEFSGKKIKFNFGNDINNGFTDFNKFKINPQKLKSLNETKKNTEIEQKFPDFSDINEQLDDILNNIDNDGAEEIHQKIKELNQSCTTLNNLNKAEESKEKDNNNNINFRNINSINNNNNMNYDNNFGNFNLTQRNFGRYNNNPNLCHSMNVMNLNTNVNNDKSNNNFNKLCLSTMTKRKPRQKYEEEENTGDDFYLDSNSNKNIFANYTNYGTNFLTNKNIQFFK